MELQERVGFVYAHPDDESFMSACLIRLLADRGLEPVLLLATPGDAGQKNGDYASATREELAAIRMREMEKAASVMGLAAVEHLHYPDGKLSEADESEVAGRIAEFAERRKLTMLCTFPPDGNNGHPDHVAISRYTAAAVRSGRCPSVRKLLHSLSPSQEPSNGPSDFTVDSKPLWPMKAAALRAHESQKYGVERYFGKLDVFPANRRYETFRLAWQES